MNSDDVTTAQAEKIHRSLFRLANYLVRLKERMEKRGFPYNDPLYAKTREAYDAVCTLCMELHYHGCNTGVGHHPRE